MEAETDMFWIKENQNIINIIVSNKMSFGTDQISVVHLNLTDAVFHDCQDAFIWCWLMQVGTTLAADCWIPPIIFCFPLNLLHGVKQDQNINISIIWGWGLRAYTSDSDAPGIVWQLPTKIWCIFMILYDLSQRDFCVALARRSLCAGGNQEQTQTLCLKVSMFKKILEFFDFPCLHPVLFSCKIQSRHPFWHTVLLLALTYLLFVCFKLTQCQKQEGGVMVHVKLFWKWNCTRSHLWPPCPCLLLYTESCVWRHVVLLPVRSHQSWDQFTLCERPHRKRKMDPERFQCERGPSEGKFLV